MQRVFQLKWHSIIRRRGTCVRLGPLGSREQLALRTSAVLLYLAFRLWYRKLHATKAVLHLKHLRWLPSGLDRAVQTYTVFLVFYSTNKLLLTSI